MKNIKVINGNQIKSEQLKECIVLDSLVYGHLPEMIGELNKVSKCLLLNPDFFLAALHEGKVVGYLNAMPISYGQYLGLKLGCLSDPDIFTQGPERIDSPGKHRIYVSSLVVHPNYQDGSVFLKLLEEKQVLYERLKRLNISIECELSEVVTEQGRKCAKRLGWSPTGKSRLGFTIYENLPLASLFKPKHIDS